MSPNLHRALTMSGVSIIICNYNYAQFVAIAIESALAQDYIGCEVIVVDDGSTDGSQEVLERYRDRDRIILLPNNSFKERAVVLLSILDVMASQRWAERLLELRFDVNSRPKWLEPVLSRLAS
jgi:cellulose synthase/poly-beta-1,6-N-acetylglucosamine synthase-like glycosyltransferase